MLQKATLFLLISLASAACIEIIMNRQDDFIFAFSFRSTLNSVRISRYQSSAKNAVQHHMRGNLKIGFVFCCLFIETWFYCTLYAVFVVTFVTSSFSPRARFCSPPSVTRCISSIFNNVAVDTSSLPTLHRWFYHFILFFREMLMTLWARGELCWIIHFC